MLLADPGYSLIISSSFFFPLAKVPSSIILNTGYETGANGIAKTILSVVFSISLICSGFYLPQKNNPKSNTASKTDL